MTCRLCGADARLYRMRTDVTLHLCAACGFVSGVPARDVAPADRYRHYYDGPVAAAPVTRYREWLERAESTVGRGHLLEVGAGAGGFAAAAVGRGWRVAATEMAESARERLASAGAEVFIGDMPDAGYAAATFDLVVALEVIEHVERPADHLREWSRVLRPGGLLLATTPNLAGLTGRLLRERWRVVAAEHLGYFTPATLRSALRDAGFQEIDVRSRALDVFAWRPPKNGEAPAFDPAGAAALRDRVDGNAVLHRAKEVAHGLLGALGLGDTLLTWARK